MSRKVRKCCLCGEKLPIGNLGNNPEPLKPYSSGTCCDKCNATKVIPARLAQVSKSGKMIGLVDEQ